MSPPHGSSGYTATGSLAFETLPREIRDSVYTFALVSSSPIIVWTARLNVAFTPQENDASSCMYDHPRRWNREAMTSSRKGLALGLLQCSRSIAHEADPVLCGQNAFAFGGCHDWSPVVSWLDAIGDLNRSYLTRLEASQANSPKAWQYSNGTRISIWALERNEIYPGIFTSLV